MNYTNPLEANELRKLKIQNVSWGIASILFGGFIIALGGWACFFIGGFLALAGVGFIIQAFQV